MTSTTRRIVAGATAGLVGAAAMDAYRYARYRRGGGESGPIEYEVSTGTDMTFDDAGEPAQIGQAVTDAVGVDLPDDAAGATTDVVHWLTGAGYGVAHGLSRHGQGLLRGGLATGVGAFLNSYALLGVAGVRKPIWEYEPDGLADDLAGHLLYGMATSLTYRLLGGSGDDG